MGAQGCCSL